MLMPRETAPNRARSMSDCGCSMRTPMENGFGSVCTPRACSMSRTDRVPNAQVPARSGLASIVLAVRQQLRRRHGVARRSSIHDKVGDARAKPVARRQGFQDGLARIRSTMVTSRNVPTCGLLLTRISLRCPGADELLQHPPAEMRRVLDPRPEFAVGEGAGATFAELHITLRIEHGLSATARTCRACALARSWPRSRMIGRKPICARVRAAMQPAGAGADHQRPPRHYLRRPARHQPIGHVRRLADRSDRQHAGRAAPPPSAAVTSSV